MARALVSKAPFLVLDEPGEHLDTQTADQLVAELLQAARSADDQRGILLVTHRLSPLPQAQNILLLDRLDSHPGQPATLVAQGTHQKLWDSFPRYRHNYEQEQIDVG